MKLPTILLAIFFAHLSTAAESEDGQGLRKKLVRVVKRKRIGSDQEREARSILEPSFPFLEKAKHTFHASTQQHHPQRISALQRTSDPRFIAKLREHERQREFVFGKQIKPRSQVPIRPINTVSYQVGGVSTEYVNGPRYAEQPQRAHEPRAFPSRTPVHFQTQVSRNTVVPSPAAVHRQPLAHSRQANHRQSDSEALQEHSAALRRHREQLDAAKRLIKFHEERYLKHQTSHIVPLPAPVYRPRQQQPPRPIQRRPVIANRRRQQVRRFQVQTPRPHVTTTVAYQSPVPQIQGYIEPAIQIQTHAEPAVHFPVRPEPPQVPRTAIAQQDVLSSHEVAPTINLAEVARERCVDKVVYVEEVVEDDAIECHHSYEKKCHTTYVTDFKSESEEECDDNFKKDCFIKYKPIAMNETVEFCHTPLVKDCNIQGPVTCKTEYETDCRTRYHEHQVIDDIPDCTTIKEHSCKEVVSGYKTEQKCQEWPVEKCSLRTELVTKSSPETKCEKIPKEICAPEGCGFVPGIQECFDKTETVIQDIPEETCNLQPQRHCKQVTKLVPNLQPTEECVDVPKEICTKSKKNPRKVKKPVTKKWCYTPTKESGLI